MEILSAKNVSFSYDNTKTVVDDVSLSVNKGEYIAIIGHNGSGKSTLAKLFNALVIPNKGEIVVDGFSSNDKNSLFEIRKRVGVVFQNPDNGIIASIVEDDIAFGPENLGLDREEIKKRIDFALSAVNMEQFRESSPNRLSGGQKQRIAIAGVLANNPQILVLDESTSMLDPKGRKEIINVANKLNKEKGVTVIAITHYMEEVLFADRVYVLNHGKIAKVGTPKEIFANKEEIKNYGLELPTACYIAQKLRDKGVNIGEVLNEEQLVEELCKLKR